MKRSADESGYGIADLIAMDVIRPSYTWLRKASPRFHRIRLNRHPEFFARMLEHGKARAVAPANFGNSLVVMTKVLARTGIPVEQLLPEHLLEYSDFQTDRGQKPDGLTYTWSMLKDLGVFDTSTPGLLQAVAVERPSVEQMIDAYEIRSGPVREMLIRYLSSRAASLDYSTLRWLVYELARTLHVIPNHVRHIVGRRESGVPLVAHRFPPLRPVVCSCFFMLATVEGYMICAQPAGRALLTRLLFTGLSLSCCCGRSVHYYFMAVRGRLGMTVLTKAALFSSCWLQRGFACSICLLREGGG